MVQHKRKKVIIVGGGTAGSVIAHKLSPYCDVHVFEKSKYRTIPLAYQVPLGIGMLFSSPADYYSVRQVETNFGRSVPFFESNALGGASVINGCVHVLGNTTSWKKLLSKFCLTYEQLEVSYKEIFSISSSDRKLNLRSAVHTELDHLFQASLQSLGLVRRDTDLLDIESSTTIYNTIRQVYRSSVLDFKPFDNCKLYLGKEVKNLILNSQGQIIGICDGETTELSDVVILASGVIGTNKILLSNTIDYSTLSSRPSSYNAGLSVQDHTNLRVNVRSKIPLSSLNEINRNFFSKARYTFLHFLGYKTLLAGTGATSSVNLDIDNDGNIDTRLNLLHFHETGRLGSQGTLFASRSPGFSVSITHINPKSKGSISLQPSGAVCVKPNYLSESIDMDHLREALKKTISLLETPPLSSIVDKIDNEETIRLNPCAYIENHFYSGYHLIGGCANLVDCNFKIQDNDNAYICDASIFDQYVSSNIHASVVLLADLFASKFLRNNISEFSQD